MRVRHLNVTFSREHKMALYMMFVCDSIHAVINGLYSVDIVRIMNPALKIHREKYKHNMQQIQRFY